jgi:multicomponent Na+:H+ antiporter subunit C
VEIILAIVVGGLFSASIYLILRRSLTRLIIGLAMLTNAANLLIFTVGGLVRARPPLIPIDADSPEGVIADPLPQALILTAIVIGFGVLAFAMVLAYRTFQAVGSDDLDDMISTDTLPPPTKGTDVTAKDSRRLTKDLEEEPELQPELSEQPPVLVADRERRA